jgi:hypothetical protein
MKSDKLAGAVFLFIGLFMLADFSGTIYWNALWIPAAVYALAGYFLSVKYFNSKSSFLLFSSLALFFGGITLLIDALFRIKHQNEFVAFSFFFAAALIFVLLYFNNRNHVIYLPLAAIALLLGWSYVAIIPARLLSAFVLSVSHILSPAPFLYLLIGFVIIREKS